MRRLVAPDRLEDECGRDADEADRRDARKAPSTGRSVHPATLRDGLGARARGYTGAVPDEATDNGFPSAEEVDVDALFAALREEIRRSGADPGTPESRTTATRRAPRPSASGRCRPTGRSGSDPASGAGSARPSRPSSGS